MPNQHSSGSSSKFTVTALALAVTVLALIPWLRNHDYLRDFYDYGLFINVNARLAEGQRPYVDFSTPAQSAAFLINFAAEKIFGGTYVGMTGGAALLIIFGGIGMTLVLARRFNPWVAALLALAICAGSASQHTIAFYNPLGVMAMAMTVWAFALAPVLRRENIGWHAMAGAGLILGGLTKINFHLLACLMAVGWVMHAGVTRRATLREALSTLIFIFACGFIMPIGIEIAWTGASWKEWYYNIVELPLSARGARISYLFTPSLYLSTLHGYYGQLRVPQVGLIGVLMPAVAVWAAWRQPQENRTPWRAVLLLLAGFLGALSGAALLLTNNEIAYITFAAALVIAVGLWLGFEIQPRRGLFTIGVILPAVILAAAGWESAWLGQRSQFGHDLTPRHECQLGERAGADFRYIHGLHLPPSLTQSLAALTEWRNSLPDAEKRRVFYGPGTEWLEHVWPVNKIKGLPLVASAFDNDRDNARLENEVIAGDTFDHVVVMEAWDHWNQQVEDQLRRISTKQYSGTVFTLYHKLPPGTLWARPLEYLNNGFATNVVSTRIVSDMPANQLSDSRQYFGTMQGTGRVDINAPCRRISAEMVIARPTADTSGDITVSFAAYARIDNALLSRLNTEVTLPDGVEKLTVRTELLDGSGLPVAFTVNIPEDFENHVVAGWRGFQLTDMPDPGSEPPQLQALKFNPQEATAEERAALLPASMRNLRVFLAGSKIEQNFLMIRGGTETWIEAQGLYRDIKVTAQAGDAANPFPNLTIIYYKGGRLEQFSPLQTPAQGVAHYNLWTPENGGWIGIIAPQDISMPMLQLTIDSAPKS